MLRNRDINRKNRATLVVQGTMYGNLSISCIETVNKEIEDTDNINPKECMDMLKLAVKSSKKSLDCFAAAQEQISKHVCDGYALDQHKQLSKAIENGEDIDTMSSVSNHIVTKEMIGMYKSLYKSDNQG